MGETRIRDNSQKPTTRDVEAIAEDDDKEPNLEIQFEKEYHWVIVCHQGHISA